MKTKLSGSVAIKVENTISVLRDVKRNLKKIQKNMQKRNNFHEYLGLSSIIIIIHIKNKKIIGLNWLWKKGLKILFLNSKNSHFFYLTIMLF